MRDLIYRETARRIIDSPRSKEQMLMVLSSTPSVQPEIVMCKDCKKHNVSVGYQEDCCPLYEFRGMSYGHEHDYQYCCYAERREE